jgi:hypothetical protein
MGWTATYGTPVISFRAERQAPAREPPGHATALGCAADLAVGRAHWYQRMRGTGSRGLDKLATILSAIFNSFRLMTSLLHSVLGRYTLGNKVLRSLFPVR